jgi:murein DD-endopeptidase MepM/ murein hydrolase activator NlpD
VAKKRHNEFQIHDKLDQCTGSATWLNALTTITAMTMIFAILLMLLTNLVQLVVVSASTAAALPIDYTEAFQNLQSSAIWPLLQSKDRIVSSSFGPRINPSCNCYDFHRGIDIDDDGEHQVVVAVYPGAIQQISNNDQEGTTTILIEHEFDQWVRFHHNKASTKKWYTVYEHVQKTKDNSSLQIEDVVPAGHVLGTIAHKSHLHFEVRVGSYCSLEWAMLHPSSKCNRKGYDPHVHPMLLFGTTTSEHNYDLLALDTLATVIQGVQHGVVQLSSATQVVNRYILEQVDDNADDPVLKSHTLDLNLRKGYNAKQIHETPNPRLPYLSPKAVVLEEGDVWKMELIIPYTWVVSTTSRTTIRVSAYDLQGELMGQTIV